MRITNLAFIICIALATSCNDGDKKDSSPAETTNNTEPKNNKSEPAANDNNLKQNGDYTALFNRTDCKVISAEEMSAVLGVALVDQKIKNICSYKSEFPDNKTWYLSIILNNTKKDDVERMVQSFKSDKTGQLALEISESGDTYFCIQHLQGYLSINNINYDGSITIAYGSFAVSRKFSKEERLEHLDFAKKIANMLLKKYQK